MSPETLSFLKWLLGGAATTWFFAEMVFGQPSDMIKAIWGNKALKAENKRLRAENAELRKQITGIGDDARKALPDGSTADRALLERIGNLEAIATGDPSAGKV